MLYNHGWEKQQTQRPKGSGPKKGQVGKKTHQKKSCHGSKRTISKAYVSHFIHNNFNHGNVVYSR